MGSRALRYLEGSEELAVEGNGDERSMEIGIAVSDADLSGFLEGNFGGKSLYERFMREDSVFDRLWGEVSDEMGMDLDGNRDGDVEELQYGSLSW